MPRADSEGSENIQKKLYKKKTFFFQFEPMLKSGVMRENTSSKL